MTKQFIDEVNQDIQDEKLILFWNKYRFYVMAFIIFIIAGTAVLVGFDKYKINKINQESEIFESYLANGNVNLLDELIAQGEQGSQFIAVVEKAKQVSLTNVLEASNILYTYSKNASSPQKEYAVLASVWVGIEQVNSGELLMRLNTINSPQFKVIAQLTGVEVLLQNNKNNEAIKILQELKNNISINPSNREIVDNMLSVLVK
ncbi:MAG: hypothetical protein P8N25_04900 [Alphaproteobacteria bacterium]|jgi:hypothetical protein|nr:hypothetical protein [Alphaproteobacteria bacterium]